MVAVAMPRVSLGRQVWNFGRHYVEMCIAMCALGVPLTLAVLGGLSSLADVNLRQEYPELSLLVIAFALTLPMAAWMLFRGMARRPTLEMIAAAFAVAIVMIAAASVGIAGNETLQLTIGQFCGLSCVAMLGVMLFRLDLYTGRTGHHMAHTAHAA